MKRGYQYIFGPVSSWRLGSSLGIDLLSQDRKICNFDCLYCQLGGTHAPTKERRLYIPTDHALAEVGGLPADVAIDTITFSGMGEPTLALNLGETILAVKAIRREPVAVLTNASLMGRDGVREELSYADIVVAKMDVCSQVFLQRVNRPAPEIAFDDIVDGLKKFRASYGGKLVLQIMFIRENQGIAAGIAKIAEEICPDEIQINTPLRPCQESPLPPESVGEIVRFFRAFRTRSVYECERPSVLSLSPEETLRRRGKVI